MKIDLFSYKRYFKNKQKREGLLLCIEGNWGEIAPLEGFSKESLHEALMQTQSVCHAIIEGASFTKELFPSVSFGLSSALHPLKAKGSIPICSLSLDEGHMSGYVKVKLHSSVEKSIEEVKDIQKKYPKVLLRLDINQKWSLEEALFFAKHFDKSDFDYIEEPCTSLDELKEFSEKTLFPIALDETIYKMRKVPEGIASLKALVLKPTLIGGLYDLTPFVKEGLDKKLDVILSSSFESGVGLQNIYSLASHFELKKSQGLGTQKFFEKDLLEEELDLSGKKDTIFIKPNKNKLTRIKTWKSKKSSSAPSDLLDNLLEQSQQLSQMG